MAKTLEVKKFSQVIATRCWLPGKNFVPGNGDTEEEIYAVKSGTNDGALEAQLTTHLYLQK